MNGQNQKWSKWDFTLSSASFSKAITKAELQQNLNRFFAKLFGTSAIEIKALLRGGKLKLKVLVEGGDIIPHDPAYFEWIKAQSTAFFVAGFGASTQVVIEGKLVAGSKQDGTPNEQLVVLPTIKLGTLRLGAQNG